MENRVIARTRLAVIVLGTSLPAFTLLLPQPEPVAWAAIAALLAGAIAIGWSASRSRSSPLLDRWGGPFGIVLLAGLIAATGGAQSHYQDLLALVPLSTAAARSSRRLALHGGLAAAAAVLPVVYDRTVSPVWITDLGVDFVVWTTVAVVVHLQARVLDRHLRAVQQSESRFRAMAAHSPEGIYELQLEPTLHFTFVNPALEQLSGFSADEIMAQPGLRDDRFHPDDRELFAKLQAEWERPDRPPLELRWRHANGRWVWASVKETAVHDSDGRIVAVRGTVRDITAHKRTEQRLRQAVADERAAADGLRQLDEMKNAFLSAVSHELRTPLTAIIGYCQTQVERRDQLSAEQAALFDRRLLVKARQLERLLGDLLDVDRLSRDAMTIDRQPTDVLALARRVIAGMDAHDHVVAVEGDAVTAPIDAPKVERIVENLVANALRHTPAGTHVTVRVRSEPAHVSIHVDDDGPGVPAALRTAIFEPFVQAEPATLHPSPGTGIGLALVARFAQLHGGTAWVSDRPGGGSSFAVRLPAPGCRPRRILERQARTAQPSPM